MDKEKQHEKLREISDKLELVLKNGIPFSDFISLLEKNDLGLYYKPSNKYEFIFIVDLVKEKWGVHLEKGIPILPGSSILKGLGNVSNIDKTVEFIKKNKDRIVFRSFKRTDGNGLCYRFYLKKLINS